MGGIQGQGLVYLFAHLGDTLKILNLTIQKNFEEIKHQRIFQMVDGKTLPVMVNFVVVSHSFIYIPPNF